MAEDLCLVSAAPLGQAPKINSHCTGFLNPEEPLLTTYKGGASRCRSKAKLSKSGAPISSSCSSNDVWFKHV